MVVWLRMADLLAIFIAIHRSLEDTAGPPVAGFPPFPFKSGDRFSGNHQSIHQLKGTSFLTPIKNKVTKHALPWYSHPFFRKCGTSVFRFSSFNDIKAIPFCDEVVTGDKDDGWILAVDIPTEQIEPDNTKVALLFLSH